MRRYSMCRCRATMVHQLGNMLRLRLRLQRRGMALIPIRLEPRNIALTLIRLERRNIALIFIVNLRYRFQLKRGHRKISG